MSAFLAWLLYGEQGLESGLVVAQVSYVGKGFAAHQVVGVILECAVTRSSHTIIWPLLRLKGTVKGRRITIIWCCTDSMYK